MATSVIALTLDAMPSVGSMRSDHDASADAIGGGTATDSGIAGRTSRANALLMRPPRTPGIIVRRGRRRDGDRSRPSRIAPARRADAAAVERLVERGVLCRCRALGAAVEEAGLQERGGQPRALLLEGRRRWPARVPRPARCDGWNGSRKDERGDPHRVEHGLDRCRASSMPRRDRLVRESRRYASRPRIPIKRRPERLKLRILEHQAIHPIVHWACAS